MASKSDDVVHEYEPFFCIHKSGRVVRYMEHDFVPPSKDPTTGVDSKDVVVSSKNNVKARIYLPQTEVPDPKLPLIIYVHGGGFAIESAFSSQYHKHANSLAAESRSVVVSVEYRLAPEHPLPACYDDCWEATKWVESQARAGPGTEPWLTDYVDFKRVFLAGDSAGANIVHEMVVRAGREPEFSLKFEGLILVHPFFGIGDSDRLWNFICPETTGPNDPRLNPSADKDLLSNLCCERVLVIVAEEDFLKERGVKYNEALKKSDWKGVVEIFETEGEGHVFHLLKPDSEKVPSLMKRIVEFVNKLQP